MPETQTQVRQADVADAPRVFRLLDKAVRQFVSFGKEDLRHLLARERVWLADAGEALWGFVCVTPRTFGLADLRGLALINGWRVDAGVQTLLNPVLDYLHDHGSRKLVCLGAAAWVVPPLQRAGFELVDRIVYFEREVTEMSLSEVSGIDVRPVTGSDLQTLLALDKGAFEPLWRFDQGHFMELLVTTGHCTIAERAQIPVGYAITDVVGDIGFVVRLAVHPAVRGQGVGSCLLAESLRYCQDHGVVVVRLNTQESNEASHHLYERFEFRRAGRRVPVLVRNL
jgi:ribosomal-protein-alanine N-acetyltransferase